MTFLVLGIGFIIFVLLLAFVLSNPLFAGIVFVTLGLANFTVYAKYKTFRGLSKYQQQAILFLLT